MALRSGLAEHTVVIVDGKKIKGLKRAITDPKEFDALFRSLIGHKMNVMITIMALSSSKPDGKVTISMGALAQTFNAHPVSLGPVVKELEAIGLLKVERPAGEV